MQHLWGLAIIVSPLVSALLLGIPIYIWERVTGDRYGDQPNISQDPG